MHYMYLAGWFICVLAAFFGREESQIVFALIAISYAIIFSAVAREEEK